MPEQLEPGTEVPFAWDEPMCSHLLKITASAHNGSAVEDDAAASTVLDIDKLPTKQVEPLVVKVSSSSQFSGPQDLRSKLEGALAGTVVRTVRPPYSARLASMGRTGCLSCCLTPVTAVPVAHAHP